MGSVNFYTRLPTPRLAPFVSMLWYWSGYGQATGIERVLPSGTSELVLSLQDSTALVCGARSESFLLKRSEKDCIVGVHFHPGGAHPFLDMPADAITNEDLPLDLLWGAGLADLRSSLSEAPTVAAKLDLLERWLFARACKPLVRHAAVRYALDHLFRSSCDAIVEKTGYSQRRFNQLFKSEVGLTPKLYQRVGRFQAILTDLEKKTEVDWADLSLTHGYFDQAHFNHDFKSFSGHRPSDYLAHRTGHLNHILA